MVTVPRSHERGLEKLNALHRLDVDQTLTPVRARESWGYSVHGSCYHWNDAAREWVW